MMEAHDAKSCDVCLEGRTAQASGDEPKESKSPALAREAEQIAEESDIDVVGNVPINMDLQLSSAPGSRSSSGCEQASPDDSSDSSRDHGPENGEGTADDEDNSSCQGEDGSSVESEEKDLEERGLHAAHPTNSPPSQMESITSSSSFAQAVIKHQGVLGSTTISRSHDRGLLTISCQSQPVSGYVSASVLPNRPTPISPRRLQAPVSPLTLNPRDNVGHIGVSSFRFPRMRSLPLPPPPPPPPLPIPFIAIQPSPLAPPYVFPSPAITTTQPVLCSLVASPVTSHGSVGHLQPLVKAPAGGPLSTAYLNKILPDLSAPPCRPKLEDD